jgi:hypothetical protein
VIFCAGCSQSLPPPKSVVAVSGKVVDAAGEPVRFASIVFEPKDRGRGVEATGMLDKNGKFTLRTYSNSEPDGAVKGSYLVRLEPLEAGVLGKIPKGLSPTLIPEMYLDAKTSNLTVDITDDTDDLVLKLK